jgi:hypothetical protein
MSQAKEQLENNSNKARVDVLDDLVNSANKNNPEAFKQYKENLKSLKEAFDINSAVMVSSSTNLTMQSRNIKRVFGESIENTDLLDIYPEDPELVRLKIISLYPSPQNIRWLYNHDEDCLTSHFVFNSSMTGESGVLVKGDSEELQTYIEDYLLAINVRRVQNWSIRDNHCFAESIFWKEYNMNEGIILPHHLNYITLTRVEDDLHTGKVKWIQFAQYDSQLEKAKSKTAFKKYDPYKDYTHTTPYLNEGNKDTNVKVSLMEDDIVRFNYFTSPPMKSLLNKIIWKMWMEYDAKTAGQVTASPVIDAEVALDGLYDVDDVEYYEVMDRIAKATLKHRNSGCIAHGDRIVLKPLEQHSTYTYSDFMLYVTKKIHKTLLAPYNLMEAVGSELATSRTVRSMFDIFIKAIRYEFLISITELCKEQLEFAGREKDVDRFELYYEDVDEKILMTQVEKFNSLMELWDRGIIGDPNEIRELVSIELGIELPELSEKELNLAKVKNEMYQMPKEEDDLVDAELKNDLKNDRKK